MNTMQDIQTDLHTGETLDDYRRRMARANRVEKRTVMVIFKAGMVGTGVAAVRAAQYYRRNPNG